MRSNRIYLLTGPDHAAVHQARHEGRQLSGSDRDHGLVQEREPGFDLPLLQSNPALLVAGTGDQIRVAAALADRGGVGCSGVCGLEVTQFEALLDHRQQQIAPLGALARVALQQPLSTGKPAGRAAHLAAHEQAKAEPERAADGASALAGVHMSVVGTFKCPEVFIVPTDQVCRHRKQFEILGFQWSFLIGERERLERIGPGALPIRPAGSIELVAHACSDSFHSFASSALLAV